MSFGFDPLVGTLLHPGNPEDGVRDVIDKMKSSTLHELVQDLGDDRTQHSLSPKEVAERLIWLTEEIDKRDGEKRAKEAHRVRAEEANIYADLAEDLEGDGDDGTGA